MRTAAIAITSPSYTTLQNPTTPYVTLHYTHYTITNATASTVHHVHYTTTTSPPHSSYIQLQLHYTTLLPAVVMRCPLQTIATTPKHNFNHLSVQQWIRPAIRDSQRPTFPVGLLFLKLPPFHCAVLLTMWLGNSW